MGFPSSALKSHLQSSFFFAAGILNLSPGGEGQGDEKTMFSLGISDWSLRRYAYKSDDVK